MVREAKTEVLKSMAEILKNKSSSVKAVEERLKKLSRDEAILSA